MTITIQLQNGDHYSFYMGDEGTAFFNLFYYAERGVLVDVQEGDLTPKTKWKKQQYAQARKNGCTRQQALRTCAVTPGGNQ